MQFDVLIIGAGAAGLMCAGVAGARGKKVLVVEHTNKIAEKIRISGGGRCNFTNLNCAPDKFISNNKHFCTSSLKRFTQDDFIKMVESHNISYHEKTLGQLFCDDSANDIIKMLTDICEKSGVQIYTSCSVDAITKNEDGSFYVRTSRGVITAKSVVVATGGLSVPKIGASPFGYKIAEQFGIPVTPVRAGLVPLTFDPHILEQTKDLSGVSIPHALVKSEDGTEFQEAILFTHKGVSGPAILQISSYWHAGQDIVLNMYPQEDAYDYLKRQKNHNPKIMLVTAISNIVPKRVAEKICGVDAATSRMADFPDKTLKEYAQKISNWRIKPSGSEGYRTAEVTLGGVDTNYISSKTFECKTTAGLYFIGEVLDVTGHLGGYNFQWAWSSAWCAGQYV